MAQTASFKKLFDHLRQVDGRSLALRKAAEMIEMECASTDIGPASKPLRSDRLDGLLVPDQVVRDVAKDLRAQAESLEEEASKLQRKRLKISGTIDVQEEEENNQDSDKVKKFRMITRETHSSTNPMKTPQVQS
ncbi:MAG: hypothetical protein ISR64_10570 [Deltaproteobacteria bacterium]|nr:hypothetical protein [Deltaproteobacteria bacterium]